MSRESLNILQQKSLLVETSSQNSHQDDDKGAEANLCSYPRAQLDSKSLGFGFNHLDSAPPHNSNSVEKQTEIAFPLPKLTPEDKLELYAQRIEGCSEMGWAHVICRGCHHIIKKEAVKFTCLSNYCQDPECIKNRQRTKLARLISLGIRSKTLYHFVIGFEPVEELSKSHLLMCHKQVYKIIHKVEKTLGKLHLIVVRDINKSNNRLRLHFHIASLPVKDFRMLGFTLLRANKLISKALKSKSIVQLIGYRLKEGVFDYFSKRASGVFGHRCKESNFSYPDIMHLDNYFETFYNTRTINLHNLKSRRVATEFIKLIDGVPEKCPHCGHSHFALSLNPDYKPPDPNLICPSCSKCTELKVCGRGANIHMEKSYDISFYPEDWNFKYGMCKNCAEPLTPEGKDKIFQREFNNFLNKKRGALDPNEKIYGGKVEKLFQGADYQSLNHS